jgi:hypothetical protein
VLHNKQKAAVHQGALADGPQKKKKKKRNIDKCYEAADLHWSEISVLQAVEN